MDTGQPLHTLNWILQTYLDGLPDALRKIFLKMRVKDFLAYISLVRISGLII